jgi:hypothetical protein
VAIPAHPYQRGIVGGSLGDRVLELQGLLALEVINGSISEADNEAAARAAHAMGLAAIGGSDAHGIPALGRAYTGFSAPIGSEEELVQALKSGQYTACWNDGRQETNRSVESAPRRDP